MASLTAFPSLEVTPEAWAGWSLRVAVMRVWGEAWECSEHAWSLRPMALCPGLALAFHLACPWASPPPALGPHQALLLSAWPVPPRASSGRESSLTASPWPSKGFGRKGPKG